MTDLRTPEVLAPSIEKLSGLPIRYVLGRHETADFERAGADVVVRNPGVRRNSLYLATARAVGARIEMEIAWFFRACRGKTIGVTGTRGKGTTTMLLYDILKAAGKQPLPGRQHGGSRPCHCFPKITPRTLCGARQIGIWMLEGLHTIRRSPHLAIFTNLLPDHLDAFESMEDYGAAKTSIYPLPGAGRYRALQRRQ